MLISDIYLFHHQGFVIRLQHNHYFNTLLRHSLWFVEQLYIYMVLLLKNISGGHAPTCYICFIFFVICTPCIIVMLFLLLFCFLCLLCQIHTPTVGVFHQNFIYYLSFIIVLVNPTHSYLFVVVINIGLIVILFMGIYFICHCQDNLLFDIFHNDCKNNI